MVNRLRSLAPRAVRPRRLRGGDRRGDAACTSSSTPPTSCAPACRPATRRAGRASSSATCTTSRLDCREARGLRLFDELARNVRYAVRRLRKTPGIHRQHVATLALCLGSTLTIFAVVDSVLLRPLPFPDAGRLVSVYNTYPRAGVPNDGCSLTNYYERRGRIAAFAGVAAYREGAAVVGEPGRDRAGTRCARVARFLRHAGPRSGAGARVHRRGDRLSDRATWPSSPTRTGAAPERRSRARSAGTSVSTAPNGSSSASFRAAFSFLSSKAQDLPAARVRPRRNVRPAERHSGNSDMIARLRSGVTVAEAQAQIDAHNAALEATNPDAPLWPTPASARWWCRCTPITSRPSAGFCCCCRPACSCLLLIGAVNVINLLLIRASGRVKELAVRQAIGASRRHVVSEVLVETILVAAGGGLLGLAVGRVGHRAAADARRRTSPARRPRRLRCAARARRARRRRCAAASRSPGRSPGITCGSSRRPRCGPNPAAARRRAAFSACATVSWWPRSPWPSCCSPARACSR